MSMTRRLGVLGWVLLVIGCAFVISGLYPLLHGFPFVFLVDLAVGGALIWWAWNTGNVTIPCPSCRAGIDTKLKATTAACGKCGHRVELRPVQ